MQHWYDFVNLAAGLRRDSAPYALATLVKKEGSTYRQPGARLLVQEDGTVHGVISGGCLEGELREVALDVLRTGRAVLRRFDLADENEALGFGAGCDGAVHMLIEPGWSGLGLLLRAPSDRQQAVLAHVIGGPEGHAYLGGKRLYRKDGTAPERHNWPPGLELRGFQDVRGSKVIRAGTYEVFLEVLRPQIELLVFGAGPDARPLVGVAKSLGWRVQVVGAKPVDTLERRAPGADGYHFQMHAPSPPAPGLLDQWTAAVVMNHNKVRDSALVRELIGTDVGYIGVLGPRARCADMIPRDALGQRDPRVHGPTGLDLGADAPEEVALSVVAEILAYFRGHSGGPLRDKRGAVHQAAETSPLPQ